jgi:RNA polymerase sigma-70 factor (ECF subfamily)
MRTQETKQIKTFEMYRSLLFSIAYRMLGSVMEAEDMVQETYLRYINNNNTVESPKAFLSTIITRLCLDHLKSAKVRREEYIGPWLPEPLRTDEVTVTPVDKYEMISMAALVLLENLSPLERAVFLLREVFEYDYAEIAGIVEKSEANCRQVYHRARQYLQQHRPRFKPSPAAQHKLVTGFLQAMQTGDVDALAGLLAEDVTLWSDGGGKATAARQPVVGKDRIARLLVVSYRKRPDNSDIELAEVNGVLSILYRVANQVIGVMSFGGNETGITDIWTVWNPDKLQHLQERKEAL